MREDPGPVFRAIAGKRAIRRFTAEPLAPEHLERILDAGRRAGSSKNRQRWTFIVCRDRAHLRELAKVGPYADHIASAAAAVALVTPDPRPSGAGRSIMWDLGLAAENMFLAAWELGIGSVPATVYEPDLAKELLGLPDDQYCEYILSFGYPANPEELTRPPRKGGRRPLSEIGRQEHW